jgi:hypothetical protein
MNFDKLEYLDADLEQAPRTLTISGKGRASYESHTNAYRPDDPEIGFYETTMSQTELDSLRSRLLTPPFKDLPDHWGKVRPSERYRRIRITTAGEAIQKLAGASLAIGPGLQELFVYLDKIVIEVMRHPRQTLRSELSQVTVNAGRVLTATLTLSNSGSQPTLCRDPSSMLKASDGHLELEAWPDKADVRAADVMTFEVKRVTKQGSKGAKRAESPLVEISPQGSVAFRLEAQFPKTNAGIHHVRVKYESLVQQLEGYQLVYGQLFSRTTKASIP